MSIVNVRNYLKKYGYDKKIQEFEVSSATVALAAEALNTKPERIAKSLTFKTKEDTVMVVTAGNAKISNSKYKNEFGVKAKMLSACEVLELVGHAVGGVCPFAVNENVKIYLDNSLKKYKTVFPACGSANSAIELTISELEKLSNYIGWVDVTDIID